MISNNEYKILGVNADDDSSVIKLAFKKLASKYHPDKNKDSTESDRIFVKILTETVYMLMLRSDMVDTLDIS